MEEEEKQRYWNYKSHGSKLLELYYPTFDPQTTVVPSRDYLVAGIEELMEKYPDNDEVPLPDSLKAVYLFPDQIETWHSGEGRLHDRRRYTRTANGWKEEILVP